MNVPKDEVLRRLIAEVCNLWEYANANQEFDELLKVWDVLFPSLSFEIIPGSPDWTDWTATIE